MTRGKTAKEASRSSEPSLQVSQDGHIAERESGKPTAALQSAEFAEEQA